MEFYFKCDGIMPDFCYILDISDGVIERDNCGKGQNFIVET